MNTENPLKLDDFLSIWKSDNNKYLQEFFDTSAFLDTKYGFCYENFATEDALTPLGPNGDTTFASKQRRLSPDAMAKYKAAMAKNIGRDVEGFMVYTGSIMPFGDALTPVDVLKQTQWEETEHLLGNASSIMSTWMTDVQNLVNSADSLFSNQAAQLMSTGKIVGKNSEDGAVMYVQDALVPEENRVTAGAKAWTDPNCDILDQMRIIEDSYRERSGDDQDLNWRIPLAMWRNVFLKNAGLLAKVKEWRTIQELPTSSGGTVLEAWVVAYLNSLGLTSPIRIVHEGEVKQDPINGGFSDTRRNVKGWDPDAAVLMPAGTSGLIKKGVIQKAKLFSRFSGESVIKYNIAYIRGGLYAVITSVTHDANGLPVYHVDLEGNSAPALTCAPYMVIVDTKTAD